MSNATGFIRERMILLTSSGTAPTEIEKIIAHPILYILFFFALMYAGGIYNAGRERWIAKYTLTPFLRKFLFFDWPRFTLRNIIFQIYLVVVTAISIATILLPTEIASNRVAILYANVTFLPFLVVQCVFSTIQIHKK